jgi:hypothetical protein
VRAADILREDDHLCAACLFDADPRPVADRRVSADPSACGDRMGEGVRTCIELPLAPHS